MVTPWRTIFEPGQALSYRKTDAGVQQHVIVRIIAQITTEYVGIEPQSPQQCFVTPTS
jgi:hypothetical protein